MKAVMAAVSAEFLASRKRIGAAKWGEVWDVWLHMPPSPDLSHQDIQFTLQSYLSRRWAAAVKGKIYHDPNLTPVAPPGDWTKDYRVPDLALLGPPSKAVERKT